MDSDGPPQEPSRARSYVFAFLALVTHPSWSRHNNLQPSFPPPPEIPRPSHPPRLPLPYGLVLLTGRASFLTHVLHERYGPVVRLGPNHLSFIDLRAWRDIYGHRTAASSHGVDATTAVAAAANNASPPSLHKGHGVPDENAKSHRFSGFIPDVPPSILDAGRDEHSLLRRALSHGFSEAALRSQEGRIRTVVDLLVRRLARSARAGKDRVDMSAWYNWTAFDVIGDLVLGESFGCLERETYHPFVELIVGSVRQGSVLITLNYLSLGALFKVAWVAGMKRLVITFRKGVMDLVRRRIQMEGEKETVDLFEGLLKHRVEWGIDDDRLVSNAGILVAAGSETTATILSGATYLLLSNPEVLEKLQHEVRSSFSSPEEITILSVNRLPYMIACLSEALRLYPPVTGGLVREVAEGGATIAGQFVPGGTMVECQQWSMNHSTSYWKDPWAFRPERFLHPKGAEAAGRDTIEALQPFSLGPRNCIGRNLAYAEMRLILANMIYHFDLKLADESKGWIDRQKAYPLWVKGPLDVYISPLSRGNSE
ncbi:Isotrichodermin C-15 hydroxylase [Madurella mycetomatis]|uniref:Isotrichodermin C-15 hydroxylase n=1 Tax=Madurella mycetomatis TaxID=100816 RepID=A0A175VWP3_9PEZI|nr:Isotrichodermin C-15 hydroxylase [Madurella mycetomatis]KXX83001.1 Isotrichodermin C-15 hydroxylase [Madurella mycetomatis]